MSIPVRPFWIFSKIGGDNRGSRCTTGVNNTGGMEKIFKQKNCNNFVWAPLGSRVSIYKHFCLQDHFKVSAAWYCSHSLPPVSTTPVANLPPVSLIPGAICHRRRWHRGKFAAGIVDTGGKFAAGVNNTRGTGGKICHRCRWHRWCTFTCEYLREFSKKFEMTQMLFSGAWGKVVHQINLKQKISWHCPFKYKLPNMRQIFAITACLGSRHLIDSLIY